jgi:hypothetical protein
MVGTEIHAQGTGAIRGRVLDAQSKEPLAFANVYVKYGSDLIGATTDIDGRFLIKPLNPSSYNVTISFVGYPKTTIEGVRVSSNKIEFMGEIEIQKGIEGKEFVFTEYTTKLIDPEDPMAIPLRWKDIEKNPQIRNIEGLIASVGSGVYQKDEGQPLHFRGARSDANHYFVDGIKVKGPGFGIPSTAIGEMTVYTGGVPAQYGDITGGVVIVETKSYFDLYNQYKSTQRLRKAKASNK